MSGEIMKVSVRELDRVKRKVADRERMGECWKGGRGARVGHVRQEDEAGV